MRRLAGHLTIFAAALAATAGAALARPNLSSREFNDLKKDAQRAAAAGQVGELRGKIRDLARDDSERAAELLGQIAVAVPQVYDDAVAAIASMRSDDLLQDMLKELGKSRGSVQLKIIYIDALAERGDDPAVEGLAAALSSWERQPEVARAAVQAIDRLKALRGVDGLITLLGELEAKQPDGLLVTLVQEALTRITGESFLKAQDWRNFWEPRKASFRPRTGDPDARPAARTGERQRPTFFGSEIKSNRLVFVIDISGSMTAADPPRPTTGGGIQPRRGPQTGGGANGGAEEPQGPDSRVRIDRAKYQLQRVISQLPGDAVFTILAYSGALMQGPSGLSLPGGDAGSEDALLPPKVGGFEWLQIWQPRLTRADDRSKESATKWVEQLQANGSTFTYNALRYAFEVEGADTIVLLSDGYPTEIDRKTGQQLSGDEILERVKTLNRFKRMRIDTFGFDAASGGGAPPGMGGSRSPFGGGAAGGLGKFMQDLAAQNGGEYTAID